MKQIDCVNIVISVVCVCVCVCLDVSPSLIPVVVLVGNRPVCTQM